MKKIFIILIGLLSLQSYTTPKVVAVVSEKDVVWSFSFISENEIIYTLKEQGKAYLYNFLTKKKLILNTPKIYATGQGGLLDIHYNEEKGKKYIYYTFSERKEEKAITSLAKGELVNNKIVSLKTIFQAKLKTGRGVHFGSRLVFDKNHIFMTIGDRGERELAQNVSFHNGKILRLNFDGTAATNNPFVSNKKALPEIWSLGHRNPQGITKGFNSNKLYSVEFGPRGGDELNLIKKGVNYGWPIITYGKEYWGPSIGQKSKKGLEQPIKYWVPSISPSGMDFYRGKKLSKWTGSLFIANLSSKHLRRLV